MTKLAKNLNDKLSDILHELKYSNMVVNNDKSTNSINEFTDILNKVTKLNTEEKYIGNIIRYLYKQNKRSFSIYLQNSGNIGYILLTDGFLIKKILNLQNDTYIIWNMNNNQFEVKLNNINKHTKQNDKMNEDGFIINITKNNIYNNKKEIEKIKETKKLGEIIEQDKNNKNKYECLSSWADMIDEEENN